MDGYNAAGKGTGMNCETQPDVELAGAEESSILELLELVAGTAGAAGPGAAASAAPDAFAGDNAGDDAALVERARSDPQAFGLLYERYVDRIYAYVYHRVGNAQDAEDLTARTFHRALDALDGYEERGLPFAAWLFRIAHNLVANWHRDRGRRRFLSLDRLWSHRTEENDPQGELEKKEAQAALWSAINRLPAERRDLLIYKFSSRLSNLEIGELMEKSEGAVKSLYFRTLAALRKELEERGWGLPAQGSAAASGNGANEEGETP